MLWYLFCIENGKQAPLKCNVNISMVLESMRERDRERMGMSKEWSAGISSPDVGISYSLHTYCLTKALCVGPSCSRLKLAIGNSEVTVCSLYL